MYLKTRILITKRFKTLAGREEAWVSTLTARSKHASQDQSPRQKQVPSAHPHTELSLDARLPGGSRDSLCGDRVTHKTHARVPLVPLSSLGLKHVCLSETRNLMTTRCMPITHQAPATNSVPAKTILSCRAGAVTRVLKRRGQS